MLIQRRSPISGKVNEQEILVTEQQLRLWREGMLIQRAMPDLTAGQREFIMTGITEAEWEEMFGTDE